MKNSLQINGGFIWLVAILCGMSICKVCEIVNNRYGTNTSDGGIRQRAEQLHGLIKAPLKKLVNEK